MKAVAAEAGSADLAAIESEIKKLDTEIDQRVYELYGLTPEEIKIVESAAKQIRRHLRMNLTPRPVRDRQQQSNFPKKDVARRRSIVTLRVRFQELKRTM